MEKYEILPNGVRVLDPIQILKFGPAEPVGNSTTLETLEELDIFDGEDIRLTDEG